MNKKIETVKNTHELIKELQSIVNSLNCNSFDVVTRDGKSIGQYLDNDPLDKIRRDCLRDVNKYFLSIRGEFDEMLDESLESIGKA